MPKRRVEDRAAAPWTDEELSAALMAYRDIMRGEQSGSPLSKKVVYRQLSAQFGRTEKAFEYRMQNISAVLAEQGQPWIKGLKPAVNVGEGVKMRLVSLLALEPDESPTPPPPVDYKKKLPAIRDWLIGVARQKSSVTYDDVMRVFGLRSFELLHALRTLGRASQAQAEPIITALIVDDKTGHCSGGFEKEFGIVDDAAERAKLYRFWSKQAAQAAESPPQSQLEQRAAKFSQVELRPGQAAFRKAVFLACKGQCVISGCDIPRALDAAHRLGRDWRLGHNLSGDGYLLRKDLHALYDAGLLTISDHHTVQLDPSIVEHYHPFNGIKIRRWESL